MGLRMMGFMITVPTSWYEVTTLVHPLSHTSSVPQQSE